MELVQMKNIIGLIYAAVMMAISFGLLRAGKMTRRSVIAISIVTFIIGFILLAPLIPVQMQMLVLGSKVGNMPVLAVVMIISLLVISSLFIGRVFCGYACPIGAVQELVYSYPGRKFVIEGMNVRIIHAVMTLLFFAGGLVSFSLLGLLGVRKYFEADFGSLTFYVFLLVLAVGLFVYRPFCRLVCPFGFLSSLLAGRSGWAMGRKHGCNSCSACERTCPVGDARKEQDGSDCFLCLRCSDKCKKDAIRYSKR